LKLAKESFWALRIRLEDQNLPKNIRMLSERFAFLSTKQGLRDKAQVKDTIKYQAKFDGCRSISITQVSLLLLPSNKLLAGNLGPCV
jgi:ABC-type uncharacterized transport system ATPase subunit